MASKKSAVRCENRRRDGSAIVSPACFGAPATHELTIRYHARAFGGGYEQDVHSVCRECGERIKRDAEGRGYEVLFKGL